MTPTIRLLSGEDAEQTASLVNFGVPEPASVETIRTRLSGDGRRPGDSLRLGAFEDDHQIGYGHIVRDEWMPPGLHWLHIAVDPARRRESIGSQLYAALRDHGARHGATTLRGQAAEAEPASLAFAQSLGVSIDRHIFESVLDLASFDDHPFAEVVERVRGQGIGFVTMADVGDTPDARRRLYALQRVVAGDIPGGSEAASWPYEAFLKEVCDSKDYLPDGQIIATDGEQWIGMVGILNSPVAGGLYNGMTGVLPAYRGRQIALALKLLAIDFGRRHGATYLRTHNDSENAPMLAINRRLGYRPEPGYYRLLATLPSPA